ncbi:MAG: hypothetical protein NT062_26010 [Proteobacteria bacterium]|nr:hypothetical protein [Pseudomonadota bacterium]
MIDRLERALRASRLLILTAATSASCATATTPHPVAQPVAEVAPSTAPAPPTTPAVPAAPPAEVLAKIHQEVSWRVDGGYDTREQIAQRAAAAVARDWAGDVAGIVSRELDASLEAHAKAEATWQGLTDGDKLDRAFAALERDGILTRPHFLATQDEASEAMKGEMARAKSAGRQIIGWVYFTESDTHAAMTNKMMGLFASAPKPGDAASRVIIRKVIARLKAQGLSVDWPYEDLAYPINIIKLDWKKRRAVK